MPEATEKIPDQGTAAPTDGPTASGHQGNIGRIPYDTRPPTVGRFKWTYWCAQNPRLFPPKVTGLGWGINFWWVIHPRSWVRMHRAAGTP